MSPEHEERRVLRHIIIDMLLRNAKYNQPGQEAWNIESLLKEAEQIFMWINDKGDP